MLILIRNVHVNSDCMVSLFIFNNNNVYNIITHKKKKIAQRPNTNYNNKYKLGTYV